MSEDFEVVVQRALTALGVSDQVTLIGTGREPGTEAMTAELQPAPSSSTSEARPATVTIVVSATADAERLDSDTRAELRRALRMCPLCQRIGQVEKIRGADGRQSGCAVRCPACGQFEIDQELIVQFRSAWERNDRDVLDRLPSLSAQTRAGSDVRLTVERHGTSDPDPGARDPQR